MTEYVMTFNGGKKCDETKIEERKMGYRTPSQHCCGEGYTCI